MTPGKRKDVLYFSCGGMVVISTFVTLPVEGGGFVAMRRRSPSPHLSAQPPEPSVNPERLLFGAEGERFRNGLNPCRVMEIVRPRFEIPGADKSRSSVSTLSEYHAAGHRRV